RRTARVRTLWRYTLGRRTRAVSETPVRGQTTSYAEWRAGLGGGSSEETIRIGRPRSISGTEPVTVETNGTVGAALIDAVVRAHGSSQVNAQPSKAIPIGPVTAHMSSERTTPALRHDITHDNITWPLTERSSAWR